MSCNHSLRLGNLCTQCGETVGDESNLFCLLHDNDNLKTTKEEATKMAKEKKKKLDEDGKLVLIIDLDQTILHASCNKQLEGLEYKEVKVDRRIIEKSAKNIANEEAKAELNSTGKKCYSVKAMRQEEHYDFDSDILIDQPKKKTKTNNACVLYTFYISKVKYYVKLRPHLKEMLDFCYDKYEMHVYTMGNREYAEYIVSIVDPERKYFGTRIITRDENEKLLEKNLNRLSSDHSNIIILDDRGDVWKYVANLINVQPFFFFRSGDINAPEKIGKVLREEYENTNDIKDLIYQHDDNCLVSITTLLSKIHEMYFERCKNVKKILKRLRMPIFRHKSFYIDKKIQFDRKNMKRILKNCNGQYKKAKVDIIIADNLNEDILNKQAKYKADIVSIRWVFDCYYSNLPLEHDSYVLKRYDEDEFADELENMLD